MVRKDQHTIRCCQMKISGREKRTENARRLPQRQHPSAQRGLFIGRWLRRTPSALSPTVYSLWEILSRPTIECRTLSVLPVAQAGGGAST